MVHNHSLFIIWCGLMPQEKALHLFLADKGLIPINVESVVIYSIFSMLSREKIHSYLRNPDSLNPETSKIQTLKFEWENQTQSLDFTTFPDLTHLNGKSGLLVRISQTSGPIRQSKISNRLTQTLKYDPEIQVDAEDLIDVQQRLEDRYPKLLTAILEDEAFPAARSFLGTSLHSIQKFYAHSTWLEQGNQDILENLGLPGFTFDNLAEEQEDVCVPCTDSQGNCMGNVVQGSGLTTGYYTYTALDSGSFLVPKPSTGGKCSHGGVLDDTADEAPKGGINKDTSSPCFSPHNHLHEQAVEQAVQATSHYLSVLLDGVGPEKYRKLFDLYHGSALSIVIDTTGSMGNDIAAVQDQVAQIVNSTAPVIYILVPYNDPYFGPLLKTEDPQLFLDTVNSLNAHNGGDKPEKFWHGLQLALTNTPDYGDIFCFTDAPAKDGEIMESMIYLAEQRHTKVSIVYSDFHAVVQDWNITTGIPEYRRLADSTGGLFIPSNKFNIDDITPILEEGVESSDVDLLNLNSLFGFHHEDIPIDDSIFDFEIRIAGDITSALLHDFTGTKYDLMDVASLEVTDDVEIVAYTESFRSLKWKSPRYGMWNLETNASVEYSISIQANSTLDWLGDFSILDPSPPHPHYRPAQGRPLINTIYYLEITLLGYLESKVSSVNKIDYVDETGGLIRTIDYNGEIDDTFYIRSEPLPEMHFYIKLWGHVSSGNQFVRLMSVLITPVEASVEVLATSDELAAKPGNDGYGDFLVTNYGLESNFSLTCIDELKFYKSMTPTSLYLATNESGTVTVTFHVKRAEEPGTVSMVTFTAQSLKQTASVNSAITHFTVLPKHSDTLSPNCNLTNVPDCTGYMLNGICSQKNWTTTAILQDPLSGILSVRADPPIETSVSDFIPGDINPVTLTGFASCCTPQVDIIGVDMQGNIGKCQIDMGKLGGLVYDLEVESVGTTWVTLIWHITPADIDVLKYELLINDIVTQDIICSELTCGTNVTQLSECSPQTFQLIPHFLVDDKELAGVPAYTQATTLDVEPEAPTNGRQVGATPTTVDIEWDATNSKCLAEFRVCYLPLGWDYQDICERTSSTSYQLRGLEACAIYRVEVTALSPSGLSSTQSLIFNVTAEEAEPGIPEDVTVDEITTDTVNITWNDPLENPYCIDRFVITYEEVGSEGRSMQYALTNKDHYATINDLNPCTNYVFNVRAVSVSGVEGPVVQVPGETAEIKPLPPTSVVAQTVSESSILVSWDQNTFCVDHFLVCYHDVYVPEDICLNVTENSITLNGLLPCTKYTVSVVSVSPSGKVSDKTHDLATTPDARPGAPENFSILQETPHTVEFTYDPPSVNPQCAVEYDFKEIKLEQNTTRTNYAAPKPYLDGVFRELDACTNYELRIRAASATDLYSGWVSQNALTLEEIPSEPRNFNAAQTETSDLALSWWQPELNSMCVANYSLEWLGYMQDSGNITINPSSPEEPNPFEVEYTLTGLIDCTNYQLTLHAITQSG
ncbi:unnamed protein product, partial [Meganyctiphanes norvegica]